MKTSGVAASAAIYPHRYSIVMKSARVALAKLTLKVSMRIRLWRALRRVYGGSGLERVIEDLERVERKYDINID